MVLMPPTPKPNVECCACVCDYACRGGIEFCSPYAVCVLWFRGTGWLLWQGDPAGRARVEIDCAEHPAGLAERRFRRVSCQGDLAAWPEGSGVAPGGRRPSLSDRDGRGGYRARRIGCPAMGAEAEMLPWQRDAGRRCVCRYIQRIVAPRGFITHGALPTAYNQRVATQSWSAPMHVLWSHPTHAGYACFSGWPSILLLGFGCAPDYPVELDWRGSLAGRWFQQWSGMVLSWVRHQYQVRGGVLQ